jgi:hypothetical protein
MNVEEAFEPQISKKPDSDTFTVFALEEEQYKAGDGGLIKMAVDYNDLEEFYNRVSSKYDCVEFHEEVKIPLLRKK